MIAWFTACSEAATPLPFALEKVAEIETPTAVGEPAGGPRGLWVAEQGGRIWRIEGGKARVVLDLSRKITSGGETGLLGMAHHPRWPEDPRVFVNYTYSEGRQLRTRIASFRAPADGEVDPSSEVEVLAFDQPWSNHNSGSLAFGPDGMLYAGVGDGGAAGDPERTGQDPSDWLGSVLRVDVSTAPYTVPPDNPWVGDARAKPELWAIGLRNPWGMHFDGADLWLADVGQNEWEEIDRIVRGGNYGWNVMEGRHCFRAKTCDAGAFVAPVAEYSHDVGASVTGGLVYRGPSVPAIDGKYVYGDFSTGRLWALDPETLAATELADSDLMPSCFGRDRDGALYVGDYRGTIWRVKAK
ncbi:MAG: PQQ-dependent sugar dehydrogenase [Myxococcota bacterium]